MERKYGALALVPMLGRRIAPATLVLAVGFGIAPQAHPGTSAPVRQTPAASPRADAPSRAVAGSPPRRAPAAPPRRGSPPPPRRPARRRAGPAPPPRRAGGGPPPPPGSPRAARRGGGAARGRPGPLLRRA